MSTDVTPAAAEILRAAKKRIRWRKLWTQGAFQKFNLDAGNVCECVDGALISAAEERKEPGALTRSGASLCLSLAARSRGHETASRFNDHPTTTHADVLALLDEAIALAESLAGPQS